MQEQEKKYRVIASSVGARGNKVLHHGDEVPADSWKPETAKRLLEEGFIVEINPEKKEPEKTPLVPPTKETPTKEIKAPAKSGPTDTMPGIDDILIEDLRIILELSGFKFNPSASKEELFKIYLDNGLYKK